MKILLIAAIAATALEAAETKTTFESLPPTVQTAARKQIGNAAIVGASVEKEKGKTMYEVETKVDGRGRDLLFNSEGALVEAEEETDLASIPGPARDALRKRAGGGNIRKVEKVTAGKTVTYEAVIRTAAGRNVEIAVNADGSRHKED
jgi:uncharacterized membrane protein YkoI